MNFCVCKLLIFRSRKRCIVFSLWRGGAKLFGRVFFSLLPSKLFGHAKLRGKVIWERFFMCGDIATALRRGEIMDQPWSDRKKKQEGMHCQRHPFSHKKGGREPVNHSAAAWDISGDVWVNWTITPILGAPIQKWDKCSASFVGTRKPSSSLLVSITLFWNMLRNIVHLLHCTTCSQAPERSRRPAIKQGKIIQEGRTHKLHRKIFGTKS